MPSYEHKKLIENIINLDAPPSTPEEFSVWIRAEAHLEFLCQNACDDEIVIFASGKYSFIHTLVVSNSLLTPVDQDDLLQWNCSPYTSIASYVWGGGRDDVWVERGVRSVGAKTLENAIQLVYGRTFDGWSDNDRTYYEIHQEYTHITDIHWRPEHRAYCRFDQHGDLAHIVSITPRQHKSAPNIALASFKWAQLEEYLAATDSSLVRMFDFTLLHLHSFSGWSDGEEDFINENEHFFYRQKVMPGQAAYTRGVQIIPTRQLRETMFRDMKEGGGSRSKKQYADFIIQDWRNKRLAKVSTDPRDTTNYFEVGNDTLPFEMSPAFFRPEVLLKYKTDRKKYTVGEREVHCRSAWSLRGIDINDAGQVHAYIKDLRYLPYAEQLHWSSYNEEPKTGISERAITNDFKGEWTYFSNPLQQVLSTLNSWKDKGVFWWTLREETLFEYVSIPVTSSRDEWSESFMDLSKLVVEGFELKSIRSKLDEIHISYDKDERSLVLLEKLINKDRNKEDQKHLKGLRTVQLIRSKVKGHSGSATEANELEKQALIEHETLRGHFQYVCELVSEELKMIERLFV